MQPSEGAEGGWMGAALERQHILDKDYFAFMLQLVEADAQASSHKVPLTT